ncbi:MAG: aminopeptidase [Bryobacteraceae bacterium]
MALLVVALPLAGAEQAKDTVEALKKFQESLGLKRTGNFRHVTDQAAAAYRCYYTGKLELPPSYDELRFENGSAKGCKLDSGKYDVFFYPMEAVASGSTPLTASLAESSTERLLVVATHEDFHQYQEDAKLPSAATEAASTLLGFVTATEFAQTRFGEKSDTYKRLAGDADLFLQKALIVNAHRDRIASLYESFRLGRISRESALLRKAQLFRDLETECSGIPGSPASFNKCPAAFNNAGLAFDFTYTKHYPLLHRLFVRRRRDLRSTLSTVQEILRLPLRKEEEFVAAVTAK